MFNLMSNLRARTLAQRVRIIETHLADYGVYHCTEEWWPAAMVAQTVLLNREPNIKITIRQHDYGIYTIKKTTKTTR